MSTSEKVKSLRDIHYFRQRFKNRVFSRLVGFFVREAQERGVSKKDIADRLRRDPSQITRWLSSPSNLTLDTISDLLLALDAEPEPPVIVRFADRPKRNYAHPLAARALGLKASAPPSPTPILTIKSRNPKYEIAPSVAAATDA